LGYNWSETPQAVTGVEVTGKDGETDLSGTEKRLVRIKDEATGRIVEHIMEVPVGSTVGEAVETLKGSGRNQGGDGSSVSAEIYRERVAALAEARKAEQTRLERPVTLPSAFIR
jgi:hypothetical protein